MGQWTAREWTQEECVNGAQEENHVEKKIKEPWVVMCVSEQDAAWAWMEDKVLLD